MRPFRRSRLGRALVATGAAVPIVVGTGVLTQPAHVSAQATLASATYSGRSCVVMVQGLKLNGTTLLADGCYLGDSGQVPAAGGMATPGQAPINVLNVAGIQLLSVAAGSSSETAGGANGVSNASVSTAGIAVLPNGTTGFPGVGLRPVTGLAIGTGLLSARAVNADTSVDCNGPSSGVLVGNPPGLGIASPDGTGAATRVVGVSIANGDPAAQNITTDQPMSISVGGIITVSLNQRSFDPGTHTATGNAVVVDLNLNVINVITLTGRIIIGHSESDLTNCVFNLPKTPGLPPTGSAAGDFTNVGHSGFDARTTVLPVGAAVIVATAGVLAWRRRRELHDTEGESS